MLYYMPSPSSLPKPRVSIVLTDVIVEDVTVNMIHVSLYVRHQHK